ncbi:cell division protein SepF [Bombiscardovia coagulans]|uniref:Cell division protein SepF n=1 Tax=Bombiscardovia coagulans TaxID=686666 RepID=A0A261EPA8_9BIFI|nr:cell division protein SepF [Bombiscardovia coagulans]OZG48690.1 cell division protein SepF [Bombiscardovia coagulans]
MAGLMKNAMSYFGMADVVDDENEMDQEEDVQEAGFDTDYSVTPIASTHASTAVDSASTTSSASVTPFQNRLNRITTIHPKTYEDAQMVGRAIRDGVPVVLNLSGVSESVAYRIVDFSAGVVFGVRGSIERVTPRVFLLSPAQVNIKVEEPQPQSPAQAFFGN